VLLALAGGLLVFVTLSVLWKVIVAVASVGAVLSGFAGYWTTYRTVKVATSASGAAVATAPEPAVQASALSIMVLPFANHTGDAQKAYVADALTSFITSDLSRIRDAFIVPVATAQYYQDKKLTVKQLGRESGVHFVLMGSVTASGQKLRISAQLCNTRSGAQLWSSNFDSDQGDLFALQDQVTTSIAASMGPEMLITAARDSEMRKGTPQVADLLMRASALNLNQQTLQNIQAREALFRQVLALEPGNSKATLGIANTLALQAGNFFGELGLNMEARAGMAKQGADLACKIMAQEPHNPDVYLPIAIHALCTGRVDEAVHAFTQERNLDPRRVGVHNNLGEALIMRGDAQEAIGSLQAGLELAARMRPPAEVYANLATATFMLGDADESVAWAQKAVAANPNYYLCHEKLALAYAMQGKQAQARASAQEAMRLNCNLRLRNTKDNLPWPGKEQQYRDYLETKYLPAWRFAGLPE
jgi:TolB-like protein/Tfp pilus assembly protein PilF